MPKLKWYEDAKALRVRRRYLGLTQHELAKISGVDRTVIADIETGRRSLSVDVAEPLWEALARTSNLRQKQLQTPEQRAAEKAKREAIYKEAYEKYSREFTAEFPQLAAFAKIMGLSDLIKADPEARKAWSTAEATKLRQEQAEHERQIAGLQNLRSVDDPIVVEIIESLRRENAEREQYIAELETMIEEKKTSED